jgi:Pyruvate/2-oxoacid:ferredoxin oxidoreductase delta subunit
VRQEGVEIRTCLAPVEAVLGLDGRATALRVIEVEWQDNKTMTAKEGSEFDIPCDLIVPALGQIGDFRGMESLANERGLVDADKNFQVPQKPGYFVAGDIVNPHLLTTAVGQATVAVESIERYLEGEEPGRRPKVDVRHFDLLERLREDELAPEALAPGEVRGTDAAKFAVHNYENRSFQEIIPADQLFLGHWDTVPRSRRSETEIGAEAVLGHFSERISGLDEAAVKAEAERCMSCGMCFECDNCVVFCPQVAVKRSKRGESTMGRYVYTDYSRCIGCHICADVCPSGYIQMGLGE